GHPPGHSGAAEHRGSGAGPRAAALCPGNHHQCRPPRRRPHPLAEHQPGRPRGQGPGPGRRPRRRARGGPGQRPARHARTTGRLWRPGGYHHRARAGLRARHPTSDGEPRMIRVCLVDDQTLVRQGVKSLLELADGIEVVAEAADGRQALEMIPEVKPDVVLMDMRRPVMSGLEALQALGGTGQLPPPITLTTFARPQLLLAGIRAGAKGYLLKDVSLDQLVSAIQTVAAGGSLVQPAVTQRLLSGLEGLQNEFVSLEQPDPLTDRETEILRLMAGGFSNKEIANSLGVAEGTVKNHVSNILSKLGVRDRTRAVLKAFELKLV